MPTAVVRNYRDMSGGYGGHGSYHPSRPRSQADPVSSRFSKNASVAPSQNLAAWEFRIKERTALVAQANTTVKV